MIKIAPSILSSNLLNIENDVKKVDKAGADYIHIDVMDGHYVPNITFGPYLVSLLKKVTSKTLDVHLMIEPVKPFVKNFIDAGADIISFHPEAEPNTEETISLIKSSNCKCGIAIHPNIDVDDVKKYFNSIDTIIVMTVIPGFGGQKFMENQLVKIEQLKKIKDENNYKYEIEVDGGINNKTSKLCRSKGADILVAGSYIYNAPESKYAQLIESLR